jgi:hypothetical protein
MRLEARESGSPAAWPTLTKDRCEAIVVGSGFGGAVALPPGPGGHRRRHTRTRSAVRAGWLPASRSGLPALSRQAAGRDVLGHGRAGGLYDVKALNGVLVVQAAVYGGGSLIYANVQTRPPPDSSTMTGHVAARGLRSIRTTTWSHTCSMCSRSSPTRRPASSHASRQPRRSVLPRGRRSRPRRSSTGKTRIVASGSQSKTAATRAIWRRWSRACHRLA